MATLSASRRNSAVNASVTFTPSSPRPSITGNNAISKMSSLNEEDSTSETTSRIENINNEINSQKTERIYTSSISGKILKEICDNGERKKLYRTRSCSERSDSGISDCSNHATTASSGGSCTSTPLLGKKFSINEEPEDEKRYSPADDRIVKDVNNSAQNTTEMSNGDLAERKELLKINNDTNQAKEDATDSCESIAPQCRLEGKFLLFWIVHFAKQ